jgi:hypothetical protein
MIKQVTRGKKVLLKDVGCGCLAKGTKILIPEGQKPIENIEIGDLVYSPTDNSYVKVTNKWRGYEKGSLIQISYEDRSIIATKDHPILTTNGYVKADSLNTVDNKIIGENGATIEVTSKVIQYHGEVYNLDTTNAAPFLADFASSGTNKTQNMSSRYHG